MTTTPPEQPTEPADQVASAALAVPGVASLHSGSFGEVGTYLAGRRVAGVRLASDSAEVHVAVTMGSDVLEVGRQVAAAVEPLVGTQVQVVVEDVVPAGSQEGHDRMTARVGSDVGPYRGPADATLHQQWRRERRAVIRLDHPDTGGDAGVLQQRLEAVDRRFRGLDGARPVAPPASAPPWQPVTRGVRRVVRRARRLGRATRATIPTGWPGHRHYIDL